MTPHGLVATILVLVISNAGTLVAIWQLRHTVSKQHENRRIMLERWADDVTRYHYRLSKYLRELEKQGVIDGSRVDFSRFPPPPMPTINGN